MPPQVLEVSLFFFYFFFFLLFPGPPTKNVPVFLKIVLHRPQQKKALKFFPKILLKPGFGQNHPHTRRGAIRSHRSACVLPTEAPGRHSTQTRTKRVLPWLIRS